MKMPYTYMLVLVAVIVTPTYVAGQAPQNEPVKSSSVPIEKKHGYAPVNCLQLYYEIHGPSDAREPPLVLLHGGGSTIETTFGRILPFLAKGRQVIAFDQQGHGRTADVADRPFSFEQSANDTAALLEHLKIERADLFGFSNGGHIALQVAIRYPTLVRKLVVASAGFKRGGHYPEFWEFMKQAKLESMPQVLRDEYLKLAPHPEQLPTFFEKSAKRMREFKDWTAEEIQSIKVPTLVLIGDADNIRPEHAVEMFRLLRHGQLAVIPGGHGASIGEMTAARFEGSQVRFGANDSTKINRLPELVADMIDKFIAAPMPEPAAPRSTAAPQKPEDWPRLFQEHLNAGDLEAIVALYEPDARFVTPSGQTLMGRDRIRDVLDEMIRSKTRLSSRVVRSVAASDIAQLYTDFEGTTVDASGRQWRSVTRRSRSFAVRATEPGG